MRADSRRQRLADEKCLARAGMQRRVAHGASLHAGHSGRNADHHLGLDQRKAPAGLVDEVAQHLLRDDVVGDHAVAHRADDLDRLPRLAAEHVARFEADRFDFAIFGGDRDDGRLVDHDAAAAHKDQHIRGPEIDSNLFCHSGSSDVVRASAKVLRGANETRSRRQISLGLYHGANHFPGPRVPAGTPDERTGEQRVRRIMRIRITARENIANTSGGQEIEAIQKADRTIDIGGADPEAAAPRKSVYRFDDQIEHDICQLVTHRAPRGFPVIGRTELATMPPVEVARTETRILLCDGLHEGPHMWPNGDETVDRVGDNRRRCGIGRRIAKPVFAKVRLVAPR